MAAAWALLPAMSSAGDAGEPYRWRLPPGFPEPRVPADNPMSAAKVELGRRLFYDRRLSADGTLSCAGCHRQELAFTDGRARALGVTGELHPRGAMSLANVGYSFVLNWDDPRPSRLETQLLTPLFGHDPVEMGLRDRRSVIALLKADWRTRLLFAAAFPGEPEPLTVDNLAKAIASFERTLISGQSAFDRYMYQGIDDALSPSARRGLRLFFSRRLACGECHGRFTFSGPIRFRGSRDAPVEMHNTGLHDLDGRGAYPADNRGAYRHTLEPSDMGRFRAPTLRNVEVTAPYMHDGSIATLDEVLDHYAGGGRAVPSAPGAGLGRDSPLKSELVRGFSLTAAERQDLLAFLRSLTDRAFLADPRFADPFAEPPAEH